MLIFSGRLAPSPYTRSAASTQIGGGERGQGSPRKSLLFSVMIFKQTVSMATGSFPTINPLYGH